MHGGTAVFQESPHWNDLIPFYEYFHGDNGAGLGASHQTGWTALVARMMQVFETDDSAAAVRPTRAEPERRDDDPVGRSERGTPAPARRDDPRRRRELLALLARRRVGRAGAVRARDRPIPAATILLDPAVHRTDNYWHVFVPGLRAGRNTATGSAGPTDPTTAYRFDSSKLLLDPYAREVVDDDYDRALSVTAGDTEHSRPPCAAS